MKYTNSTSLSDFPFKAQADGFMANLTASTYDQALYTIWQRVNANTLLAEVRKSTVDNVVNAYYNLVKSDSKIPIYNWYYVEKEPRDEYINLVSAISNKSGVTVKECKQILKQLEFSDKDGSIVKGILNPRTIDKNITETPEDQDSYKNKLDLTPYIKWGALGIGAALIAVLGIKIMDVID